MNLERDITNREKIKEVLAKVFDEIALYDTTGIAFNSTIRDFYAQRIMSQKGLNTRLLEVMHAALNDKTEIFIEALNQTFDLYFLGGMLYAHANPDMMLNMRRGKELMRETIDQQLSQLRQQKDFNAPKDNKLTG